MSEKTKVVRPELIDDVLINPGIGFMTFQSQYYNLPCIVSKIV